MWIGFGTMIYYGSIPVPFGSKCFHHQYHQATLGEEGAIHHQYTIVRALTTGVSWLGTVTWEGFKPPEALCSSNQLLSWNSSHQFFPGLKS